MSHIKEAVKLIKKGEQTSGYRRFFADFIDDWSYHQTGLYAPSKQLNDQQQELGKQLSHVVRSAWESAPGEDFLGNVIEECGGSGHLSFFRTPPAISSLMAQLMGVKRGLTDFSDICMGTGSLTLAHIYQTFLKGGAKAVARLNITGEDLSANKVKVSMLQIINLLDILGGESPLYVHCLNLSEVNSLTRERGSIRYEFSGINNADCKLNDGQSQLIEQALKANISLEIISRNLRLPVNLIKRQQLQRSNRLLLGNSCKKVK